MSLPFGGTVRVGRGFLSLCYYPSWLRDIPACLLLARLTRGRVEAGAGSGETAGASNLILQKLVFAPG